jgi:hypothetical protein
MAFSFAFTGPGFHEFVLIFANNARVAARTQENYLPKVR